MDQLLQDIRFGWRLLWRSPGFTIAAVLALALGIGATTAIFSVLDRVVLRPLPYPDAERLTMVWEMNEARDCRTSESRRSTSAITVACRRSSRMPRRGGIRS